MNTYDVTLEVPTDAKTPREAVENVLKWATITTFTWIVTDEDGNQYQVEVSPTGEVGEEVQL